MESDQSTIVVPSLANSNDAEKVFHRAIALVQQDIAKSALNIAHMRGHERVELEDVHTALSDMLPAGLFHHIAPVLKASYEDSKSGS